MERRVRVSYLGDGTLWVLRRVYRNLVYGNLGSLQLVCVNPELIVSDTCNGLVPALATKSNSTRRLSKAEGKINLEHFNERISRWHRKLGTGKFCRATATTGPKTRNHGVIFLVLFLSVCKTLVLRVSTNERKTHYFTSSSSTPLHQPPTFSFP
jgi:hypothetical protein